MLEFKKEMIKQRQRCANTYNVLTTVLNKNDEVRLHSRIIASFLDVNGEHYQNSLFSELFFKILGLDDFIKDKSGLITYREYNKYDIYMTDGYKHIILENKIHAPDQKEQIQRYIENIHKDHRMLQDSDLLVIYLSIDRKEPSKLSLGNLKINHSHIIDKNGKSKALFKNIHYQTHILPWLKECQERVKDIPNLNRVFDQYIDVIDQVINPHKRKTMALIDQIKSQKDYYKIALDIENGMPNLRKNLAGEFFTCIKEKLSQEGWECKKAEDKDIGIYDKLQLLVKRSFNDEARTKTALAFVFDDTKYQYPYFGITLIKNIKSDNLECSKLQKKFKDEIEELNSKTGFKTDEYWLSWKYYPSEKQKDFIEHILFTENACEEFVKEVSAYLLEWEELMERMDKHLNGLL